MGVLDTVKNIGSDHAPVVPLTLFVAVLCLCLVIGHLLEENRWVNESITAIIIGGVTGTIILVCSKGKDSHILTFNEEVFFIYLLPPIIFNAGFQVKKKQFFHNFLTIMLFGVIGVFISALIITSGSQWLFPRMGFHGLSARDYIAIGAIFSSTDTVCTLQVLHQEETPLLYSLVFGEGVVNDATSVVLFNAVQKIDITRLNSKTALHVFGDFCYLFSTSTVLGVTEISNLRLGLGQEWERSVLFPHFGAVCARKGKKLLTSSKFLGAFGLSMVFCRSLMDLLFCEMHHDLTKKTRGFLAVDYQMEFAGLLTAYILKTLYFGRHSSVRELAIMVLMAYLSYMLAELLELSGILTVFFCGVIMSHYAWHNVTDSSKITTRHVFSMMSFVAETAIFLYVGMDALDIEKWKITKLSLWKLVGTYSITVFLILLGRAAFVFPLSAISNYFNKREDRSSSSSIITFKQQIIIWWAGLMRGAVSIALAFKQASFSFCFELLIDAILEYIISDLSGTVSIEHEMFLYFEVHLFWGHTGSNPRNNDYHHHGCGALHYGGIWVSNKAAHKMSASTQPSN
ncbi:Sodium/hydrogen exchanger 4, partial [Cucurbita argyrosperma subsp. sororia]